MKLSAATVLIWLLLFSSYAHSLLITQTMSVGQTLPPVNIGPVASPLILNTFDATLGVLDSVKVEYSGQTTVNVILPQSNVFGAYGIPVPTFKPYLFNIKQNVSGLNLAFDSELIYSGIAGGLGVTNLFSVYDFSFETLLDENSDLLGLSPLNSSQTRIVGTQANATLSPPLLFNQRSDFISDTPLTILSPTLSITALYTSDLGLPMSGNIGLIGELSVVYDYTPYAVPAPSILYLLVTGLFGLIFARWRQ